MQRFFSPLAWPMLIPPKDWTNTEPGGYILNEVMQGHELVRRGDHALIQGNPLAFSINTTGKISVKPVHSQCRYAVRRQGDKRWEVLTYRTL